MELNKIYNGDALGVLKTFPDKTINCCVTSPPYYGLRDYGVDGQIGHEESPEEYISKLVEVFREVRRVLTDKGTLWVNIGDSYAHSLRQSGGEYAGKIANGNKGQIKKGFKPLQKGYKEKDLIGIPWMLAFALRADGWYLRQDIIWQKPNCMPESVKDRCTKSHEYIFLLTKSKNYYFDSNAIREENQDTYNGKRGTTKTRKKLESAMRDFSDKEAMNKYSTNGRNKRTVRSVDDEIDFIKAVADELECYGIDKDIIGTSLLNSLITSKKSVWSYPTSAFKGAHFATFPPNLIEPCLKAGCPSGGIVLDPFFGSGTVGLVSQKHNMNYVGIELNESYCDIAKKRIEEHKKSESA